VTSREQLYKALESLPEDRIEDVLEYVEELTGLPEHTAEAVREGLRDIQAGRVIPLAEYKRTRRL
jgi:hypothetical protein